MLGLKEKILFVHSVPQALLDEAPRLKAVDVRDYLKLRSVALAKGSYFGHSIFSTLHISPSARQRLLDKGWIVKITPGWYRMTSIWKVCYMSGISHKDLKVLTQVTFNQCNVKASKWKHFLLSKQEALVFYNRRDKDGRRLKEVWRKRDKQYGDRYIASQVYKQRKQNATIKRFGIPLDEKAGKLQNTPQIVQSWESEQLLSVRYMAYKLDYSPTTIARYRRRFNHVYNSYEPVYCSDFDALGLEHRSDVVKYVSDLRHIAGDVDIGDKLNIVFDKRRGHYRQIKGTAVYVIGNHLPKPTVLSYFKQIKSKRRRNIYRRYFVPLILKEKKELAITTI